MAFFYRLLALLLAAHFAPLIFVVAADESNRIDSENTKSSRLHRYLLQEQSHSAKKQETKLDPERSGEGKCSKDYIVVYQSQTSPQPSGIPTYSVQILNTCLSQECSSDPRGISAIHLHCGWFSSARLINPRVFRRLGYDDCLVNDGRPIPPGGAVSFEYTNTYSYPLSVSSVSCGSSKSP